MVTLGSATAGYPTGTIHEEWPSSLVAATETIKSPDFISFGFNDPHVPHLIIIEAPHLISSSKQIADPGPPIPCEQTVSSAP